MELEGRQIRIAVVGAGCVGKSCIVKRYVENTFHGNPYNPTLGIDFSSRRITARPYGTATLIILDIGGLAIDSKMLGIYLNSGVDILLLMYDVTNMTSINELRKWIEMIQLNRLDMSKLTVALVGSKADLEHLRTVRLDSHTRFKQEFDIQLSYIVSAKSGENIQACFTNSALYHVNPEGRNRSRDNPALGPGQLLPTVPISHVTLPHPPAGPVPLPVSAAKRQSNQQQGLSSTSGAAGTNSMTPNNDFNSAVCSLQ